MKKIKYRGEKALVRAVDNGKLVVIPKTRVTEVSDELYDDLKEALGDDIYVSKSKK